MFIFQKTVKYLGKIISEVEYRDNPIEVESNPKIQTKTISCRRLT